jgi:2-hydroxy-6-oxonona-2,4-dienedioate hydrolase
MPSVDIRGGAVQYELLGEAGAKTIVLTPGGRTGKDVPGQRPLAEALAAGGLQVLLWDRPNCGSSDVQFWGQSESHMRADVLAELLQTLSLGPCVIAGGSGGARDSMLTVIRHPEVATRLILWNIVGGIFSTVNLAGVYVSPNVRAVRDGGMAALLDLPEWQALIAANPGNRDRLLEMPAEDFLRVMMRWFNAYVPKPGQTIPGVDDTEFDAITVPTMIIRGGAEDIDHPLRTSLEVNYLIKGSRLIEPPWPEDAWEVSVRAMSTGTGHMFDPWPLAAPAILDFVSES